MDTTLRAQERLARTGDPAALIRFASSVGRIAGRDAALATLVDGREQLEVRRELARFPAWSHLDADAGASRWVDTAPLSAAPRVRWQGRPLPRTAGRHAAGPWRFVVATPAAIVVGRRGELVAFDPESGAELWALDKLTIAGDDRFERSFVDRGALVRCRWNRATWHDLRTGQVVADERFDGGCLLGTSLDGVARFITLNHRKRPRCLRLLEASAARPGLSVRRELTESAIPLEPEQALLGPDLLVLVGYSRGPGVRVLALELSTGSPRWTRTRSARRGLLDSSGLVLHGDDIEYLDLDGTTRWTLEAWLPLAGALALTPDTVVCAHSYGVRWVDRSSGATVRELRTIRPCRVAGARDAVFVWDGCPLALLSNRGAPLWNPPPDERQFFGHAREVVPLRGRLVLIHDDWPASRVVCLEAAASSDR